MPTLPEKPTLIDFQKYVLQLEEERGFAEQNILTKCLLLGEEIGELFKAVRKAEKIKLDTNSDKKHIGEELTDIVIYLCAIANRCNIDLEAEFRAKEEINKKRIWV